ncbi:hypothetical protein GCM10025857_34410 [Alicyclobacillus contaminans]|nr:hypothetical protein GCM10025857_34410 [Alicyclobacillus contaminans]
MPRWRRQRCGKDRAGVLPTTGKWALTGLICWLVGSWWTPLTVHAQPTLGMSAEVGFNGFYTKNDWVPVTLTVVNHGPTIHAELDADVGFSIGDRSASGTLRWPVTLPGNQTVKQIAIPGNMVDRETVHLLVNGRTVASSALSGTALGAVSLVGVVAGDTQIARVLTGVTDGAGGNPVLPVTLSPDNLPSSANLLAGLTAVAATPDTLADDLTSAQRKALLTWIQLGAC